MIKLIYLLNGLIIVGWNMGKRFIKIEWIFAALFLISLGISTTNYVSLAFADEDVVPFALSITETPSTLDPLIENEFETIEPDQTSM